MKSLEVLRVAPGIRMERSGLLLVGASDVGDGVGGEEAQHFHERGALLRGGKEFLVGHWSRPNGSSTVSATVSMPIMKYAVMAVKGSVHQPRSWVMPHGSVT
jgi:hypothetical protein